MASFGLGMVAHHDRAALVQHLQAAEREWGYDTIWIADERFYHDVYAALAVAATVTERVQLATAVTDPYSRHAAQTARAIATIDQLSGGRAILGIGAGISGLREMGIRRDRPIQWTRESVELCRQLWRGGVVDYHGQLVEFNSGRLDFPTRANIPVYIASRGPQITQLAGEVADGAIFGDLASPLTLGNGLRLLRQGAARAGRDSGGIRKVVWLQTFIHRDRQTALQACRWLTAVLLRSSRPYHRELGLDVPDSVLDKLTWPAYHLSPENVGEAARHVPDECIAHLTLSGDPELVGRQVQALFAAGADQIAVNCWPLAGQSAEQGHALFAETVIRQFSA